MPPQPDNLDRNLVRNVVDEDNPVKQYQRDQDQDNQSDVIEKHVPPRQDLMCDS